MKKTLLILISLLATSLSAGDKPYLGVKLGDIDEMPAEKAIGVNQGVWIRDVVRDSAADQAGLVAGDILVRIDNAAVTSAQDVIQTLSAYQPEDNVLLEILRDGSPQQLEASLGTWQHRPRRVVIANMHRPYIGIEFEQVNDQLAKFFEVGHGLLITEVATDSPAAKAGLQAGDILQYWNGQTIANQSDLMQLLTDAEPATQVAFTVNRKGTELDLNLTLGERETLGFDIQRLQGLQHLQNLEGLDGLKALEDMPHVLESLEQLKLNMPMLEGVLSEEDRQKLQEQMDNLRIELKQLHQHKHQHKDQ